MIRVEVTNAFVVPKGTDAVGQGPKFLVLLKSTEDNRVLPIFVGQLEAQSIAIKLDNIEFPRPLTHDLFKSTLEMLNCTLLRVEVCDLREDTDGNGTFFARLVLDMRGVLYEVDARPSDAIALALRFAAPVFVDEKVMDQAGQAGVVFSEEETDDNISATVASKSKPASVDIAQDPTESPARESLQKKLEKAIKEERYEDAAKIRDALKRFSNSK